MQTSQSSWPPLRCTVRWADHIVELDAELKAQILKLRVSCHPAQDTEQSMASEQGDSSDIWSVGHRWTMS